MIPPAQRMRAAQALIGLVAVLMVALVGRLLHLQIVRRPHHLAYAVERQTSTIPLPGWRGKILDRRHRVLAGTQDLPTVYADPREVPDHADAARRIGMILGVEPREIRHRLDHPTSPAYVVIRRHVSPEEAEGVRDLDIPGIGTFKEPIRNYPMGERAAHVLGFVGSDGRGLEGIELMCERYLRATDGERKVYRDVRRRAVFQVEDSYKPPHHGSHVILTLDAAIQQTVEQAVQKQVDKYEAESGIGLVMNCKTGAVLAMTTRPGFDPSKPREVPPEQRRNRVLTDPVEPGSIFKPFIMAPALEHAVTWPEEVIDCLGGLFVIGGRRLHDHHPLGELTTTLILARSSNIGMAKIGLRLGNARMHEALERFGFGGPLGIDLPGEGAGLLMPLSAWGTYTTTSVPMGQELAVTPLQLLTAFSALVNGGTLVRPRVVHSIIDSNQEIIEDRSEPIELRRVLDPEISMLMRDMLVAVVSHPQGTGRRCDLDRWQVMGKTGTAQVPRENARGYEPGAYLGSFIAAAPASDPTVAVLVMIRKPDRSIGYYGGTVALPAVREILEQALPYLGIPPDKRVDADGRLVWDTR